MAITCEELYKTYGYGIDLSDAQWKDDAYEQVYHRLKARHSRLYEMAQEYAAENRNDYPETPREEVEEVSFYDFTEWYGEETCGGGLENVLAAELNEQYGEQFRYNDSCLYVEGTVPVNAASRDRMLTQEEIETILRRSVGVLLKNELPIKWHIIHLD